MQRITMSILFATLFAGCDKQAGDDIRVTAKSQALQQDAEAYKKLWAKFLRDSDDDGVPDWKEMLAGTNPLDKNDKPADGDGDGIFDVFVGPQGQQGLQGPQGPAGQDGKDYVAQCPVGTSSFHVGSQLAYCMKFVDLAYSPLWNDCAKECAKSSLRVMSSDDFAFMCAIDSTVFDGFLDISRIYYYIGGDWTSKIRGFRPAYLQEINGEKQGFCERVVKYPSLTLDDASAVSCIEVPYFKFFVFENYEYGQIKLCPNSTLSQNFLPTGCACGKRP